MESKFRGTMLCEATENLFLRVKKLQCEALQIASYEFDQLCGVTSLGWCFTVVDEKKWVLARLKYGI